MTVSEFLQGVLLVIYMLATSVVLPIGLVAGSASNINETLPESTGPVFIFEGAR